MATEETDELNKLILSHLPDNEGESIMRTIADNYINEGLEKGMVLGMEKGKAEGIAIGEARGAEKRNIEIAHRMLEEKTDIKLIALVTGLSKDEISKIQNKL